MGRRSSPSRGSAFGRGRSPSPTASRRAAPPPPAQKAVAPQPTAQVAQPAAAAPGGGLMAQVASTAAGVAIGHTVGHAITGAFMGGNHSEQPVESGQQEPAALSPQQQQQPMYQQHPLAGQDPCKYELEQFLNCAQTQSGDLSFCEGFNQVLRECKLRSGGQQMYQ